MVTALKALIVVLVVASTIFALGRMVIVPFVPERDLTRRAAVWLVLTITAFVSPSLWLYVLIAVPLILWAVKNDSNPLGVYAILFFVIPPMEIQIPTGGFINLFYLDHARLLGLVILLPAAVHAWRSRQGQGAPRWGIVDLFILAYGALYIVQSIPYESITHTMRRTLLFFLDIYLVYYVFSRTLRSAASLRDVMASICLSGLVMAALATIESSRQWLLYTQVAENWHAPNVFAWLFRGDLLRAQVSTGHALTLGYVLAMSIGFWLCLMRGVASVPARGVVLLLLAVGIYYSSSRGPLLTAVLAVVAFTCLKERVMTRAIGALLGVLALGTAFLLSPLGAHTLDRLPFIGTQEQDTVTYRQELAKASWQLVQVKPWFGDPFVMLQMEALRQGQGIIDLVNAYASVALFHGLVGLTLFVGGFAAGILAAWRQLRRARAAPADDAAAAEARLLGASLVACMLATLFFMATAGNARFQWHLLGMLSAYAWIRVGARASAPEDRPAGAAASTRARPLSA